MANYIGNQPLNGEFKRLDSIESQFNNSSTSFALEYNSVSQNVGDASQLIVSLNGVIQEPLTSYTLSGVSDIVFASPPANGDTCFIILLGGIGGTVTPSDNSVSTAKLTNNSVTSAKIVNNTITADDMDSSDNYAFNNITVATNTLVTDATNDRIGVGTANPTYPLDVEDAGAGFIKGSFVSTGSAHSTISFDNTGSDAASVRVGSNNNDFYVRTSGSEKMRVTSGGSVGIGSSSPSKKLDILTSGSYDGIQVSNSSTSTAARLQLNNDNSKSLQIDVGSSAQSTYGPYIADTVAIVANSAPLNIGTDTSTHVALYTNLSERMRIDNSGNVGIGTNSPSTKVHLKGDWVSNEGQLAIDANSGQQYSGLTLQNNGTSKFYLYHDNSNNLVNIYGDLSQSLAFYTNGNNERMRIDSSGNLLVGRTSSSGFTTSAGSAHFPNGAIFTTVDSGTALNVSRLTSDGAIVGFYKDGTGVGSIGTVNSTLVIGSGDTGLLFSSGDDVIIPRNSDTSVRDAAIDLGDSGNRFKDLYLSGGVYVGGTGSANYLDDYEEGTWTPSLGTTGTQPSVTYSGITRGGKYVKVGRLVTVNFSMRINAHSGGTGEYLITGLPFTTSTAVGDHAGVSVGGLEFHPITSTSMPIQVINNNSNHVRMLIAQNNAGWTSYTPPSQFAIYMSFSYETNS